jgi:hypothetical protein
MYKSFSAYYFWIWIALLLSGCESTGKSDDRLVAEAGEEKLYLSEVSAVIPNGTAQEDSIVLAEDYVRKWVRQELVLQKAEENLSSSLKNVDKELEEYRNSLIIFRYKKELMAQRLDTTVSDAEILEVYAQNPENFKLSNSIVKAIFIKIAEDFADPEQLKEMSANTTEQGINDLRDYCVKYAKGFDIFTDRWIDLNLMLNNLPVTIDNPEDFLRENQFVEYSDSIYYYLVTIHDYKLKNEQAPIEYVKDNIKSLILNRRKIDFLKEVENNIYREGVNKNTFKIYNTETNEAE